METLHMVPDTSKPTCLELVYSQDAASTVPQRELKVTLVPHGAAVVMFDGRL